MNNVQIKIRQVLPTIIIAFAVGYFSSWLTKEHLHPNGDLSIWLGAFISIVAIVGGFFLGKHKVTYWESDFAELKIAVEQKRATWRRIVTAAHEAMKLLESGYRNTSSSRMQLRKAYDSDAFSALIDALSTIPVHELESVEAVVALMGLKKNMIEAQQALDAMLATPLRWNLEPIPDEKVSLVLCKSHAESHYDDFMRACRAW